MINIVMATYNGEKFIREQLDSIFSQTFTDWRLIVSDDCSTDETVNIVREYQEAYPNKILLIENQEPSGSAQNNFYRALKYATADYIMLSDQDDVWLPGKVEETFSVMKQLEEAYGKELPLLVHTDLKVVDENLKVINSSIFDMQNMDSGRCALNNLLVQNIVTGCTVMVNKNLLSFLEKTPKHSVMHDMWMALIASAFGEIGFLNKSTILYRQHGKNANGAKDVKSFKYFLDKIFNLKEAHQGLLNQYKQADEFKNILFEKLAENQLAMLKSYSEFEELNCIERYIALREYRLFKKGFLKNLGQIFI